MNQLADLADGASAAGSARNVVDSLSHELRRFGHLAAKPQRASTGRSAQSSPMYPAAAAEVRKRPIRFSKAAALVSGTLFHERDAKLGGANLDGARATRGKNGDLDPALLQHLEAMAVLSVERLQLGTVSLKYRVPSVSTPSTSKIIRRSRRIRSSTSSRIK